MIYKKAYQHNIRINSGIDTDKLDKAAIIAKLPGFVVRQSLGYWEGQLSPCTEIEYLSEEKLPPCWLKFVETIKLLYKQQCVLPSVLTIEKECTCDD